MSIINKMLQDLEQRHAGDTAAGTVPAQVRATEDRNTTHIAWLLVALSLLVLGSVLVWSNLHPPAIAKLPASAAAPVPIASPVMSTPTPPSLALKTAMSLSAPPGPSAIDAMVLPQAVASTIAGQPSAHEIAALPLKQDDSIPPATEKPAAAMAPASARQPAAAVKPSAAGHKPLARAMADERQSADTASIPLSAQEKPLTLNKKITQLTPQQQAENDARKAVGLAQQGHAPEAIALLEQALQLDAANADARQSLIVLLLDSKQRDEAARYAQQGVALDARQAGFAMILARLQLEKGEQKTAIATLQRSLPYASDKPEYQAFLAALLQRENRHKEAIEQYLLALHQAPQNGVWWMGLGISMQADQRLSEAREAFSRARASGSLSPELQAFVEQKLKQLPR